MEWYRNVCYWRSFAWNLAKLNVWIHTESCLTNRCALVLHTVRLVSSMKTVNIAVNGHAALHIMKLCTAEGQNTTDSYIQNTCMINFDGGNTLHILFNCIRIDRHAYQRLVWPCWCIGWLDTVWSQVCYQLYGPVLSMLWYGYSYHVCIGQKHPITV